MTHIRILGPQGEMAQVAIGKTEHVIGRDQDCDLAVSDPAISRRHAKVVVEFRVEDLESLNGVWKDGQRVKNEVLRPGEEILLGKSGKFRISLDAGPASSAQAIHRSVGLSLPHESVLDPGSAAAPSPAGGLAAEDELKAARREIDRLRRENEALRTSRREAVDRAPSERRGVAPAVQRLANLFCERPTAEAIEEKPGLEGDLLLVTEAFFRFARDVERVVSRMAQQFGGTLDPTGTQLPDLAGNIVRLSEQLVRSPGSGPRAEIETYLNGLRLWTLACLSAYRFGARTWARKFLDRVGPKALRLAVGLPAFKKPNTRESEALFARYSELMDELEPDLLMQQIDEEAARAASQLAKGSEPV